MGGQQSKPTLTSRNPFFNGTLREPNEDDVHSEDKYNEERELAFLGFVRSLIAREKKCESGVEISVGRFADTCTIVRPLGFGGEAAVYEVRHSDGHRSACKAIELDDVELDPTTSDPPNHSSDISSAAIREIAIMNGLSHQNIVHLDGCLLDGHKVFMFIELCEGGSLLDNLIEMEIYSELEVSMIMQQLFCALQYLHSQDIVHGDVKLENVLLSEAGNLNSLKLSDFGMSRLCTRFLYNRVSAGTPQYMAPEILQERAGACSPHCDIWSAGVCAYILLIGEFPFKGESNEEILQSIQNGCHRSHMASLYPGTRSFLDQLLCVDVSQRLTAAEALKEPWVCGRALSAVSPSLFSVRLSQSMNRSLTE